nr:hypothetical protein [Tanacetum cinerariifolium]
MSTLNLATFILYMVPLKRDSYKVIHGIWSYGTRCEETIGIDPTKDMKERFKRGKIRKKRLKGKGIERRL